MEGNLNDCPSKLHIPQLLTLAILQNGVHTTTVKFPSCISTVTCPGNLGAHQSPAHSTLVLTAGSFQHLPCPWFFLIQCWYSIAVCCWKEKFLPRTQTDFFHRCYCYSLILGKAGALKLNPTYILPISNVNTPGANKVNGCLFLHP